ncbi:unnamed protein product [Phaeothamnion confervicola]
MSFALCVKWGRRGHKHEGRKRFRSSARIAWLPLTEILSPFPSGTHRCRLRLLLNSVGFLSLEEEEERDLDDGAAALYVVVVGWLMLGIGCVYFLMGICCIQGVRDRKLAKYRTLVAHAEVQEALREAHAGGA